MSEVTISPRLDSMATRSAALITIGLIAVLLAIVALAALFAGDVSERTGGIVSSVLGSFATVLAGLLLFLRVETINTKADEAKIAAGVAAKKATVVETQVAQVHHDVLNGPMRENVKKAIQEDRHAQRVSATVTIDRAELDGLRRRAGEQRRAGDEAP